MRWTIDDVPVFVAVVDQNGVTAAARALGMPKSTVSKALSRLEEALGLRLIERNSRNLRVTGEGETFYRQAVLIMEQVREADAAMAGLNAVPSGRLVAALPPALCQDRPLRTPAVRQPKLFFRLGTSRRSRNLSRASLIRIYQTSRTWWEMKMIPIEEKRSLRWEVQ